MLENFTHLKTGQKIVKNFVSLAIANIIGKLIGFVTVVYLARVLNASGFGQISFAQAIVAYFALLSDLGLKMFGIREVARDKKQIKKYVNNILTLRIILAIISFGLLLIFIAFGNKPTNYKTLMAFYGLSLFPLALSLDWVFQGIERMEFIGIADILRSLVYAGLIFLFINSPSRILSVPLFALAASFIMITPLIYSFVKNYGWFSFSFNWPVWKGFLSQSLPMGLSAIMVTIYYNLDTVMLGFMKGDEVVGWYNAAYKIVLIMLGFQGLLRQAIYPLVSRYYYEENHVSLEKIINVYVKGIFSMSIPIAVGGTVLAQPLMNLFFGAQYAHGVIAFQILIWNLTVILGLGMLMNATNRQNKLLIGTALGAATNVVLNIALIPKFSLVGAAVATLLTEIVTLIYFVHESRKIINLPITRYVFKPGIAAIVMGGALFMLNLQVLLAVLVGAAVYAIIFLIIKGLSKEDMQLIRKHLLTNAKS